MINKAIFDSGIFIGAKLDRDQYNEQAIRIMGDFMNGVISKIFITNYVVSECVNFMLSKSGFQKANETFEYLTGTENIEIVEVELSEIKNIFQKYKALSITDCSLVVVAEKLNIKNLFSFDRHFNAVKSIKRLENV